MSDLNSIFVYDEMRHSSLIAAVIGGVASDVPQRPATLDTFWLYGCSDDGAGMSASAQGASIKGVVLSDMSREHRARVAFYYGVLGAVSMSAEAQSASETITVQIYCIPSDLHEGQGLDRSGEDLGLALRLAGDIMDLYGQMSVEELAALLPRMRARAQSALWALRAPARGVGLEMTRDLVQPRGRRHPYRGFFSVEEHDVSFQKFDGTHSPVVTRAAFVSSDATIVLPYDPVTDRVLLVEQFRAGSYVRGDRYPWCLEPIAGLIDAGETPEQAAIREAKEEAGLELHHLELISQTYPSPGSSAEFFHVYLGLVDLPASTDLIAGLATEAEDIRSHIFTFPAFMDQIDSGSFCVGTTVLAGLWLARHRDRLRAAG